MNFLLEFLKQVRSVVDDHCFLVVIPDDGFFRLRIVWYQGKEHKSYEYTISELELNSVVSWDAILTHILNTVKHDVVPINEDER